jgi:hypothetical protein
LVPDDVLLVVFLTDDGLEFALKLADVVARSREELWKRRGIGAVWGLHACDNPRERADDRLAVFHVESEREDRDRRDDRRRAQRANGEPEILKHSGCDADCRTFATFARLARSK